MPISDIELRYWPAYRAVKLELEQAANKKSTRGSKDKPDEGIPEVAPRRMMGQR